MAMRFLATVLMVLFLGCSYPVRPDHKRVVIMFVPSEEVNRLYDSITLPTTHGQIRGFYIEGNDIIVVANDPCDPDALSHELLHFLGQNWIDK